MFFSDPKVLNKEYFDRSKSDWASIMYGLSGRWIWLILVNGVGLSSMIWNLSIIAKPLRQTFAAFAMAALFIPASSSYAQSGSPVEAGTLVTPKGDLPLRSAPPEGFFGTKGSDVGEATANQTYRVLQQKTIPTFSDAQVWLQLQDVHNGNTGWVYSGTGNAPLENLDKTH